MNRQSTQDLQGSEITLYNTIMVDRYHYTPVQPTEYTTLRMNPKVNYGL